MANSVISPANLSCQADEVAKLIARVARVSSLTRGQPDNIQFDRLKPHHTGFSSLTTCHPLRGTVRNVTDCPQTLVATMDLLDELRQLERSGVGKRRRPQQ